VQSVAGAVITNGVEPSLQVRGVVRESVPETQYKKLTSSTPSGKIKSSANEDVILIRGMELLVLVSNILLAHCDSLPPVKHTIPFNGSVHVVVTLHVKSVNDPSILGSKLT
jgi:hypothetical protein